ncbi:hypothetical protein F5Y18DRAFT_379967 [Xylariaceae sp. FL1019]|nr:hypothetical protein F5Y18DRAFT_379967 [Xylariaceae sp. FL1019]
MASTKLRWRFSKPSKQAFLIATSWQRGETCRGIRRARPRESGTSRRNNQSRRSLHRSWRAVGADGLGMGGFAYDAEGNAASMECVALDESVKAKRVTATPRACDLSKTSFLQPSGWPSCNDVTWVILRHEDTRGWTIVGAKAGAQDLLSAARGGGELQYPR